MPRYDTRVAVIGGGISGLTTALLLQINGYRTFLYTRERPSSRPGMTRTPSFATLHGAASVLPHSVSSPDVASWTTVSQAYFQALTFRASCGVRSQVHYEIAEAESVERPPYADAVDRFEMLNAEALAAGGIPRRSGAESLSGWRFDAYFCEVPEYVRFLYELYTCVGGQVVDDGLPGQASIIDFLALNYTFYVNCAGSGAPGLLQPGSHLDCEEGLGLEPLWDADEGRFIRGHYLRVDIKDVVTLGTRFFSYNYSPTPAVYSAADGSSADVYCYPRSDGWILGGSRQEGEEVGGAWRGQETVGPSMDFDDAGGTGSLAIPAAIFDLNADLLRGLTDGRVDLRRLHHDDPALFEPGIGYRYVRRDPSRSIRIGRSDVWMDDRIKHVFHNYGHGGSGYTLSWGCAYDVLRRLDEVAQAGEWRVTHPGRQKFVVGHDATRMVLEDLTDRLAGEPVGAVGR